MDIEKHLETILSAFDRHKQFVCNLNDKKQKIFEKYLLEVESSINKITVTKDFYPNARKQFEELKYLFYQLLICEKTLQKVNLFLSTKNKKKKL